MKQSLARKTNYLNMAPFRFREIDEMVLLVSEWGDWMWIDPAEFQKYRSGGITTNHPLYPELLRNHLLMDTLSEETLVDVVRQRRSAIFSGPSIHTVVLAAHDGTSIGDNTLERVLDTAFLSTNNNLQFVLCSDTPELPLTSLDKAVNYIQRKNQLAQKNCTVVFAGDVDAMSLDALEPFAKLAIGVRALLIHPAMTEEGFAQHLSTITRLHQTWANHGHPELRVEPVCIFGHNNLQNIPIWLDSLIQAGCNAFCVRPANMLDVWPDQIDHPQTQLADFLNLYQICLEKFAAAASQNHSVFERFAADAFSRILHHREPRHPLVRNPSMAGIGELAFGPGGDVFVSHHGWQAAQLGIETFQIGRIPRDGYHDLVSHPTVRALVMATTLEGQAGWSDNAYLPFVGVCPVLSYLEQGSISGRMPDSDQTRTTIGQLDILFRILRSASSPQRQVFEAWADNV